jgi:hypothetical protein
MDKPQVAISDSKPTKLEVPIQPGELSKKNPFEAAPDSAGSPQKPEYCPTCGVKTGWGIVLNPKWTEGNEVLKKFIMCTDPWHDSAAAPEHTLPGAHFLSQFLDVENLAPLTPHYHTCVLAAMAAFASHQTAASRLGNVVLCAQLNDAESEVSSLRAALQAAIPFLFEYGRHHNDRCYKYQDDMRCFCGIDDAKKLAESALLDRKEVNASDVS